jgi:hypothetical protein
LKAGLPTISLFTLFPTSGALMAYGPDLTDLFGRAGTYIDRILKGAKAGELPIERPSKFSLVVRAPPGPSDLAGLKRTAGTSTSFRRCYFAVLSDWRH